MKDLNAFDIKEATKIICGSARSMGIEVKDWSWKKIQKDLEKF
jgi:ribosomal protein L11